MDIVTMGQRIRSARKMRGMNADELAAKIGIAVESLGHIECGAKKTSLQTLLNIADVLDVSLDYLAGRCLTPTENLLKSFAEDEKLTPEQEKMLLDLAKSMIPIIKNKI